MVRVMERVYACPWAAMPCGRHLDRLLEGLKTKPIAREKREGWIVGASTARFRKWRKANGMDNTYAAEYARQEVPWLKLRDTWPALSQKEQDKRSRYIAVIYEFMSNPEVMAHFVSLKASGIKAMRKQARDNPELLHTLAVADLYCLATRHLPKESEE